MAFSDMNDVEQELGEEKPPETNGNRTFIIIAGVLGGIMVLALLSVLGVALLRNIPGQRTDQNATSTKAAQDTSVALSVSQTAAVPTATATMQPTFTPTKTEAPTNTPVIIIAPTKSPTLDVAVATRNALLTQTAVNTAVGGASATPAKPTTQATTQPTTQATTQPTTQVTTQPTTQATTQPTTQATTQPTTNPTIKPTTSPTTKPTTKPTATALPTTGIADELGTTGLILVGFVLAVVIFVVRRLRTAS